MTEMYVNKNFDKASKMWDKRILFEMEDFYNKRNQGHLTDSTLQNKIKTDVTKYFNLLDKFKIDKVIGSSLETEDNFTFGQVGFEYTETLKGKPEKITAILIFISEDKGKTWVIQDWKIKDIADKVDQKIF